MAKSRTAHPSLKYFEYESAPENAQPVLKQLQALAVKIDKSLELGSEKNAGLRKLLETRDCLVRAFQDDADAQVDTAEQAPEPVAKKAKAKKEAAEEVEAPKKKQRAKN